ncbi:MAG: hypothetical protein ACP5IE_08790 [Infirmifilum sp.]
MGSEDFYAQYYDILYSHRNVKSEVDFLEKVFQKHAKRSVKRFLTLGVEPEYTALNLQGVDTLF